MNSTTNLIEELFGIDNSTISLPDFIIGLIITAVIAFVLGFFYVRFGTSLSNRKALAGTLILVSITTMVIITIVKSSLALSLGLVGALSIVRFRTAIKEPEELAFFFIAIAIGLGMGAGQTLVTLCGSVFLMFIIFLRRFAKPKEVIQNLLIRVTDPKQGLDYEKVMEILGEHANQLELKRLEENDQYVEVSIFVRFNTFNDLVKSKDELKALNKDIQFNYLENL